MRIICPDNEVPKGSRVLNIFRTELRQRLNEGVVGPGLLTRGCTDGDGAIRRATRV